MVGFETHTGRTWKCVKEDVLEIFLSPFKGLAGGHNDYSIRTTDPTGQFVHHVWGVTKETAERVSRETGIPIKNRGMKSGTELRLKNDHERDDAILRSQTEDTVELRETVIETHKAVLGKVVIRVEEAEKTRETWIPKSVIGEDRRIAPWFQEKLVERFAHSEQIPVTGNGG